MLIPTFPVPPALFTILDAEAFIILVDAVEGDLHNLFLNCSHNHFRWVLLVILFYVILNEFFSVIDNWIYWLTTHFGDLYFL